MIYKAIIKMVCINLLMVKNEDSIIKFLTTSHVTLYFDKIIISICDFELIKIKRAHATSTNIDIALFYYRNVNCGLIMILSFK